MIIQDLFPQLLSSTFINSNSFVSGFSTKTFGDNRKSTPLLSYLKTNAISYNHIVIPAQIHSANVRVLTQRDLQETIVHIEDTDGVVTNAPNTILTTITADCVPIIYADKKQKIIAISHQGWRGSLKRLPQKMVKTMVALGADTKNIIAAIGPGIGACCYNIDVDRYETFMEEFADEFKDIIRFRHGQYYLNLAYLNFCLLEESGLKKEQIDSFPFCTSCDSGRFFSYRRDAKNEYGEMISFIYYE